MCLSLLFFTIFYSRVISVWFAFAYSCGLSNAFPPVCHRNPSVPTPSSVTSSSFLAYAELELPTVVISAGTGRSDLLTAPPSVFARIWRSTFAEVAFFFWLAAVSGVAASRFQMGSYPFSWDFYYFNLESLPFALNPEATITLEPSAITP
jgi:hypothetical protein